VRLYSKRGNDLGVRFPDIFRARSNLPIDNIVLDGEITALNGEGLPDFEALQRADKSAVQTFWAFDVIFNGDEDLRGLRMRPPRHRGGC